MADAYCRACRASFPRPLPAPYGVICPDCLARGEIVTLTNAPRARIAARGRPRGDVGGGRKGAQPRPAAPPPR